MGELSGASHGPLPELRRVLQRWVYINQEYLRRCKYEDAAWWYNERASLSTLAAAAWLAKGISLEEYTTTKDPKAAEKNRKVSAYCRCDLFISVRDGKARNSDFVIEAKIIWPELGSNVLHRKIQQGVIKARNDVRRTHGYPGARRLGLLIVSPRVAETKMETWQQDLDRFIDLIQQYRDSAVAWVFARDPSDLWSKRTKRFYPGTAILLKLLRNGST